MLLLKHALEYPDPLFRKQQRRKAERKCRKTKLTVDLNVYKAKKNYMTYLMNKARREYYSTFMKENSGDQQKLFGAAKSLLGVKDELCFPDHLDKTVLANDIARFFIRKVECIRNDIYSICVIPSDRDLITVDKPILNTRQVLDSFKILDHCEVYDIIQRSAKNSCALDPMPTNLVCDFLDVLMR